MRHCYDLLLSDYPGNLDRELGMEWYDGKSWAWVNLGAMSQYGSCVGS